MNVRSQEVTHEWVSMDQVFICVVRLVSLAYDGTCITDYGNLVIALKAYCNVLLAMVIITRKQTVNHLVLSKREDIVPEKDMKVIKTTTQQVCT